MKCPIHGVEIAQDDACSICLSEQPSIAHSIIDDASRQARQDSAGDGAAEQRLIEAAISWRRAFAGGSMVREETELEALIEAVDRLHRARLKSRKNPRMDPAELAKYQEAWKKLHHG